MARRKLGSADNTHKRHQQSSCLTFSRSNVPSQPWKVTAHPFPRPSSLLLCTSCCLDQTPVGQSPFTQALRSSPGSLPEERRSNVTGTLCPRAGVLSQCDSAVADDCPPPQDAWDRRRAELFLSSSLRH